MTHSKVTGLVAIGLALLLPIGWALAQPSASPDSQRLLESGVRLYEEGEIDEAQEKLRRVDPFRLTKEQRVELYETLRAIREKIQERATPANLLARAEALLDEERLVGAERLFRAVTDHPDATEADLEAAAEGLGNLQEQRQAAIEAIEAMVEEARADLEAGELEAARRRAAEAKRRGGRVGWDGEAEADRLIDQVEARRRARAEAERRKAEAERRAAQEKARQALEAAAEAEEPEPAETSPEPEEVSPETVEASPESPEAAPEADAPSPVAPAVVQDVEPEAIEPEREAAAAAAEEEVAAATPAPAEPRPDREAEVEEAPGEPGEDVEPQATEEDLLSRARRLFLQEKIAEAEEAEQQGQYRVAARHFEEVLAVAPDHEAAQAGLARVEAKKGEAPRGVLGEQIAATQLRADAAVSEFRNLMAQAEQQLQERNFSAALESSQQAKVVLDRNQRFLPASRYQGLREEAVNLAATISDRRRVAEQEQREQIEAQREQEARIRRAEARQRQQEEVDRLLTRASELRREQKYDQALELINQALFIDSTNVAAQLMKEMVADSKLFVERREMERRRRRIVVDQSNMNFGATMPYSEIMTYPSDWPELTARRLGALDEGAGESEVNRRVAQQLEEQVPVNFEANNLVNVIEFLRNTTGVNFFVNWTALENVGVEQDTPITLNLSNIPADQALRLVLQQATVEEFNPVSFSVIDGIVHISTEQDLTRTTTTQVYDIRDLLVQVPNFEEAPQFDLEQSLEQGESGEGGGGGSDGGLFGDQDDRDEEGGASRSELIQEIMDLVRSTVGRAEDWAEFGGNVSSMRELNGNLIVRSPPSMHREIISLLGQLRETRAVQISVEARFLLVDQNFLNEVGIDLDVEIDTRSDDFDNIDIDQDSVGLATLASSGVPGSFAGDALSKSFTLATGFMDDLDVSLLVRATQASRRAIALTAPRVTFFNGQRAFVTIARQVAFISDLESVPDAGGFNPTLSVVQAGVVLDVEGTVSSDRRYVTLTVRPDLADIINIRQVPVIAEIDDSDDDATDVTIIGEEDDDGAEEGEDFIRGFIEAPETELTSVRTTVSVPDRGTLMLGGQRLTRETELEAGVPVLSKIPVLNRLFTNRSKVKDERTLLILVKPTVIIQSEEEENLFPGLLENPQDFDAPRHIGIGMGG